MAVVMLHYDPGWSSCGWMFYFSLDVSTAGGAGESQE